MSAPPPQDAAPVDGILDSQVGTYAPNAAIKVTGAPGQLYTKVRQAANAVETVWEDDNFWDIVATRVWLPGPKDEFVKGDTVARRLRQTYPTKNHYNLTLIGKSKLHFGPLRAHSSTNASTETCNQINLNSPNITSVAKLTNTLAHENTHFIGQYSGPNGCAGDKGTPIYTDYGYSAATLPWLVSYAIGDLVECYIDSEQNPEATRVCFDQRIDSNDRLCRPFHECCTPTGLGNVERIRKQSGRCSAECSRGEAAFCSASGASGQ